MVTRHRLSRRSFLTDFGGGTAAIAIFGLAACSSDSTSTGSAGTDADQTEGAGQTTSTGAPASTAESGSASSLAPQPGSLAWERVNLGSVSAYVIARGSELAVVDTGVNGSEGEILDGIMTLGGAWTDLKHIILTHAHGDHVGSVAAVMENAPDALAHIGTADLDKVQAPRELNGVMDGDEVFGFQILGTPGHTPGHISVYDEASGLLLAGDAMNGENGGIGGANPRFTPDMDLATQSIKRLSSRTVDTVLFGHGEPVIEDAQRALDELIASL